MNNPEVVPIEQYILPSITMTSFTLYLDLYDIWVWFLKIESWTSQNHQFWTFCDSVENTIQNIWLLWKESSLNDSAFLYIDLVTAHEWTLNTKWIMMTCKYNMDTHAYTSTIWGTYLPEQSPRRLASQSLDSTFKMKPLLAFFGMIICSFFSCCLVQTKEFVVLINSRFFSWCLVRPIQMADLRSDYIKTTPNYWVIFYEFSLICVENSNVQLI